ncbi:WD40 repeat-like protein, partial [Atractiella rhizophila]
MVQPPTSQPNPTRSSNGSTGLAEEATANHVGMEDYSQQGDNWFAQFNRQVVKALDVDSLHNFTMDSVVCCVHFSPDGKLLAVGCNKSVYLYDTQTGVRTHIFNHEPTSDRNGDNYVRSICFSPDGRLLATGSEDRTIRVWDMQTRQAVRTFVGHISEIYALAFSPSGHRLVSGSGDRTARVWDMESNNIAPVHVFEIQTEADDHPDAGVT